MSKYKQQIINDETGEIISESDIYSASDKKLRKFIVDKMLEDAKCLEEIDSDMLYAWCKITKEINGYGQIKILGPYRDKETEKSMIEDITITGYTMRIIDKAHPFSGMIMKNRETFVSTWTDLWEEIGCTNKRTISKIKKFLTKNDIIREFKVGGDDGKLMKRLVVNPFLFRNAQHSSQISIIIFQDYIKESINMSCYPIRWLQRLGYIK